MAKRVYISPSDQVENKYAWGNTNEHVQCQRIAEAETAALRRCGVEHIDISDDCTVCSCDRFWSHRATGGERGSQGAVIVCREVTG